jgi:hypothetical protein
MTFYQFKCLSEDDQEYLLWRKGVELGRREERSFHFVLYQVDGFYLEVKYYRPFATIIQIACFEDLALLKPYLKNIYVDIGDK